MNEFKPKHKWTGWEIFWVCFFVLLVIGMFTPKDSTYSTKSTPTKSAWCQTHAHDQWSGQMDPVIKRYLNECV